MHQTYLLIVTALGEGGFGLLLLVWPPVPMALLLGVDQASPQGTLVARVAGVALVAIAVTCWLGRKDHVSPTHLGLLLGVLIYDLAATGILAYAGWFLSLAGLALWPAVGLHAALAVWCVVSLLHYTMSKTTPLQGGHPRPDEGRANV
jgi:hypothetical protein